MTDPREGAITEAQGVQRVWLPAPPSANRWWRNVRGRMVLSREAREYKSSVATLLTIAKARKIDAPTPVALTMHWHRARKSGDLDKRLGVLLDALQGQLYDNDSQIVEISAHRHDSTAACNRDRVVVTVESVAWRLP